METVKVDLQKLQLLNDRISQLFEALNQVRLSAHGVQHTTATQFGQGMIGQQGPWGQTPYAPGQQPYGQAGYAPFGMPQILAQLAQGISHTTPWGVGTQGVVPQFTPFGTPPAPYGYAFGMPPVYGGGISHTTAGQEPWTQVRVQQTFPFAYYNVPPVTIY